MQIPSPTTMIPFLTTILVSAAVQAIGAPFSDATVTAAGGFPAMAGNVSFLMKDVVLLAVSIYLLKQDIVRASLEVERPAESASYATPYSAQE